MKKTFPFYQVALHAFLVVTASLVVWLSLEIRGMKESMRPPQPLVAGMEVESIPIKTLDGTSDTLAYADTDKDTLLLVFTSTCPACNENQPNWRTIYEQNKDAYRIVGIGLEDAETVAAYRETKDLPFPIVLPEDYPTFAKSYKLTGIPTTIQVDPRGNVVEAWTGVLSTDTVSELSSSNVARLID